MYEEEILDRVARVVPVFEKTETTHREMRLKRGHFACEDCEQPMSSARRYGTVEVWNLWTDTVEFSFIYSPDDKLYQDAAGWPYGGMRRARTEWLYYDGDMMEDFEPYVRGFWINDRFVHQNGKVRFGDFFTVEPDEDEDGFDQWPEFGLFVYMPNTRGTYVDPRINLQNHTRWTGREIVDYQYLAAEREGAVLVPRDDAWRRREPGQVTDEERRERVERLIIEANQVDEGLRLTNNLNDYNQTYTNA